MKKTMNSKTILKTLAMAMLMPAMLLTTSCSSEDDLVNNTANTENTINKGYALPVTVNVTRQGDATTRATYTYDEGTKKGTLSFSDGDKLFVSGYYDGYYEYEFAGELTWQSGSKFSGTIYINNEWTDTADALFSAATSNGHVYATLLPAGYGSYGFLTIENNDTEDKYDDFISDTSTYTYTLATSKADGVAQFSYEEATSYSSGFALAPKNAILNFTITGLAAIASVDVSLTSWAYTITKTVTTDAFGTATFAAGVEGGEDLNDFSLTVAGNAITLPDKEVEAGHIYNITRSAASVPAGAINGKFTISDDNGAHTRQVYFSQGNLQAVFASAGSTCTWKFADNQWDYIGGRSYGGSETQTGNNFINSNGSVSAAGTVDLFGWSTSATYYGIHNSNSPSTYSGDFVDWGATMGTGWFTLETNEWVYLFYTRTASTVGGTANGRYAAATVNSVAGVILFPDSYTHPSGVTVPVSVNDAEAAYTVNSYSGADWTAMENAGAVFLPAAGNRGGSSVYYGSNVYYWSSSPYNTNSAYNVYFQSGWLELPNSSTRDYGYSVRLVHE